MTELRDNPLVSSPTLRPRRDTIFDPGLGLNRRTSFHIRESQYEKEIFGTYLELNSILMNFEDRIVECKAYNETRTERKYEAIINSLLHEVSQLRAKIKKQDMSIEQQLEAQYKQILQDLHFEVGSLSKGLARQQEENAGLRKEVVKLTRLNKVLLDRVSQSSRQKKLATDRVNSVYKFRTLGQSLLEPAPGSQAQLSE
jgi:hypothetical protein